MACICGNQKTEIKTIPETMTINGKTYHYETTFTYCPNCGDEWYTGEQIHKDSEMMTAIKWRALGYLIPQEIKAIREKHGLSREEAENLFVCRVGEWEKYEKGELRHSKRLDKMLRMFDRAPEALLDQMEVNQYSISFKTPPECRQPEIL